MSLPNKALPFGLRDVKLTPLSADGTTTAGAPVDLPASRTLSFSETEEFSELRGDDRVQASRGGGPVLEWDLESGGISLEAYAVIAGGTVTESGTTPNLKKTYTKLVTDSRPYFRIEGQAINDNGGDFHGIIYRAKCDGSLEGAMGDGEFWVSSASGKGYGSNQSATLDRVYDFVHNETAVSIESTNDEIQVLVIDATGGTFVATYDGDDTSAIAYNASAGTIQTALEAVCGAGNVIVTGSVGGPFTIAFGGDLADTNVPQITLDVASLTGGSAAVYTSIAGG